MSPDLFWSLPAGLSRDKVGNMVDAWNRNGQYEATLVEGSGADKIVLKRKNVLRYFEPVALGDRGEPMRRWLPLQDALKTSGAYQDKQANEAKANAAAKALEAIDPSAGPLDLERWLDQLGWALGMCPREGIAAMAGWMEDQFTKRFGEADAFAYLRSYEAMGSFQIAEVLPRFAIMDAASVAEAISRPEPPAFMAEEAHSHTATNFFGIPLSIAFPYWTGNVVLNVTSAIAFILREPRPGPYLDARHRDIWEGWTPAWYEHADKDWEALRPARTGAFFRWYVEHLNALLDRLASFESTASVIGEIKPLKQIALIRSVFQLQDLIGRMLITSDPYGRATWSMLALSRFDDLDWGFDLITDAGRMAALMEPLERDPEIGGMYGTYGGRVWRSVMRGILDGAAGEPVDGGASIKLVDGTTKESSRYAREYLKAVRNTIHRFKSQSMEDVFGLHAGVLPLNLSQLVALLWLRALVDPEPLLRPFRQGN